MIRENRNIEDRVKSFVRNNSACIVFFILFLFAAIRYEEFLSYNFLMNLLVQNTMVGLLACGMTFVIIAGDIDLSVGSVMAICGIVAAKLSDQNVIIPIIAAISLGMFIGAINGFMVTQLDIVPFIATLSTMIGVRGIVHIVTKSKSVPTPNRTAAFAAIGDGSFIPYIPNLIIIFIVIFFICYFVMKYSRYGRYNYAVGGNRTAAKMMGINVKKVQVMNYIVSGCLAAVAALIMTSRLGSGQYSAGDGWEMDAIAGTVIGGTLLSGGTGGVKGTFFGIQILGIMKQIFNLQGNLNTWWQNVATGVILLGVVILQSRANRAKQEE